MSEVSGGRMPRRPLTVGEIFGGARASMRRSPAASFGMAALVSPVAGLGSAVMSMRLDTAQASGRAPSTAGDFAAGVTKLFVALALGLLLSGLLAPIVARSAQRRTTTLPEAWRLVWQPLAALLATTGLLLVMSGALVIPYGLLLTAATSTHKPAAIAAAAVTGIATAAAEVAGWVLLSLSAIAVVVEQASPIQALRRSWRLVRPGFWRVLRNLAVTAIVTYLAFAVVGFAVVLVRTIVMTFAHSAGYSAAMDGLTAMVAGVAVLPFLAGAIAMVYYDVWVQAEGIDIVLSSVAP